MSPAEYVFFASYVEPSLQPCDGIPNGRGGGGQVLIERSEQSTIALPKIGKSSRDLQFSKYDDYGIWKFHIQKLFSVKSNIYCSVEIGQNLVLADVKQFDLNGYNTTCKILKVYDGDTVTIGFRFHSEFYKKSVRLGGIDAPELHSKVAKECKLSRLSREFLKSRYLDRLVEVEMKENDKYGRPIVVLRDFDTGESINQMMIQHKFARAYGGDLHKSVWTEEELDEGIASAETLGIVDPAKTADVELS